MHWNHSLVGLNLALDALAEVCRYQKMADCV